LATWDSVTHEGVGVSTNTFNSVVGQFWDLFGSRRTRQMVMLWLSTYTIKTHSFGTEYVAAAAAADVM